MKEGRVARARAVERPKTPEPIMRIEDGGEGEEAIGMLEKVQKESRRGSGVREKATEIIGKSNW